MRQVDEVTASEKRGPEVQDAFNSACVRVLIVGKDDDRHREKVLWGSR